MLYPSEILPFCLGSPTIFIVHHAWPVCPPPPTTESCGTGNFYHCKEYSPILCSQLRCNLHSTSVDIKYEKSLGRFAVASRWHFKMSQSSREVCELFPQKYSTNFWYIFFRVFSHFPLFLGLLEHYCTVIYIYIYIYILCFQRRYISSQNKEAKYFFFLNISFIPWIQYNVIIYWDEYCFCFF